MAPALSPPPPAGSEASATARANALLLIQLRWLAAAGQLATILFARLALGVALPLAQMLAAVAVLALLNLALTPAPRRRPLSDAQQFATLLVDVAVLTAQLWWSGGVGNPFVSLYLLQVVIAAVLLPGWPGWAMVGATALPFAALAAAAPPFALPPGYASHLSAPYVWASWLNYALAAALLVLFTGRIVRNLSERDARLAAYREQAAEEEHIVRMGLLASGAAHELGTPLSSIAVMLGDWRREAAVRADPGLAADVEAMRAEIARCKAILDQVLSAAGATRGSAPRRTTLARFLRGIAERFAAASGVEAVVAAGAAGERAIVGDEALAQTVAGLLDNAAEAGAARVTVAASVEGGTLRLVVGDDGPGFPPAILAGVGKPYRSTKTRDGAGLGLFLAANAMRGLGGELRAANGDRGAVVTLSLPESALGVDMA